MLQNTVLLNYQFKQIKNSQYIYYLGMRSFWQTSQQRRVTNNALYKDYMMEPLQQVQMLSEEKNNESLLKSGKKRIEINLQQEQQSNFTATILKEESTIIQSELGQAPKHHIRNSINNLLNKQQYLSDRNHSSVEQQSTEDDRSQPCFSKNKTMRIQVNKYNLPSQRSNLRLGSQMLENIAQSTGDDDKEHAIRMAFSARDRSQKKYNGPLMQHTTRSSLQLSNLDKYYDDKKLSQSPQNAQRTVQKNIIVMRPQIKSQNSNQDLKNVGARQFAKPVQSGQIEFFTKPVKIAMTARSKNSYDHSKIHESGRKSKESQKFEPAFGFGDTQYIENPKRSDKIGNSTTRTPMSIVKSSKRSPVDLKKEKYGFAEVTFSPTETTKNIVNLTSRNFEKQQRQTNSLKQIQPDRRMSLRQTQALQTNVYEMNTRVTPIRLASGNPSSNRRTNQTKFGTGPLSARGSLKSSHGPRTNPLGLPPAPNTQRNNPRVLQFVRKMLEQRQSPTQFEQEAPASQVFVSGQSTQQTYGTEQQTYEQNPPKGRSTFQDQRSNEMRINSELSSHQPPNNTNQYMNPVFTMSQNQKHLHYMYARGPMTTRARQVEVNLNAPVINSRNSPKQMNDTVLNIQAPAEKSKKGQQKAEPSRLSCGSLFIQPTPGQQDPPAVKSALNVIPGVKVVCEMVTSKQSQNGNDEERMETTPRDSRKLRARHTARNLMASKKPQTTGAQGTIGILNSNSEGQEQQRNRPHSDTRGEHSRINTKNDDVSETAEGNQIETQDLNIEDYESLKVGLTINRLKEESKLSEVKPKSLRINLNLGLSPDDKKIKEQQQEDEETINKSPLKSPKLLMKEQEAQKKRLYEMNQSFGSTIEGLNKELTKLGSPASTSLSGASQRGESASKKKDYSQIQPIILQVNAETISTKQSEKKDEIQIDSREQIIPVEEVYRDTEVRKTGPIKGNYGTVSSLYDPKILNNILKNHRPIGSPEMIGVFDPIVDNTGILEFKPQDKKGNEQENLVIVCTQDDIATPNSPNVKQSKTTLEQMNTGPRILSSNRSQRNNQTQDQRIPQNLTEQDMKNLLSQYQNQNLLNQYDNVQKKLDKIGDETIKRQISTMISSPMPHSQLALDIRLSHNDVYTQEGQSDLNKVIIEPILEKTKHRKNSKSIGSLLGFGKTQKNQQRKAQRIFKFSETQVVNKNIQRKALDQLYKNDLDMIYKPQMAKSVNLTQSQLVHERQQRDDKYIHEMSQKFYERNQQAVLNWRYTQISKEQRFLKFKEKYINTILKANEQKTDNSGPPLLFSCNKEELQKYIEEQVLEQILTEEKEDYAIAVQQQQKEYYDSKLGISKVQVSSHNISECQMSTAAGVKFLLNQVYDQIHSNFTTDGGYTKSADYKYKQQGLQRQIEEAHILRRMTTGLKEEIKSISHLKDNIERTMKYLKKGKCHGHEDLKQAKMPIADAINTIIIQFCTLIFENWLVDYYNYAQRQKDFNTTHNLYHLNEGVDNNIREKCLPIDYFIERMIQMGICYDMKNVKEVLEIMMRFDDKVGNQRYARPTVKQEKKLDHLCDPKLKQTADLVEPKDDFQMINKHNKSAESFLRKHLPKGQLNRADRIGIGQFLSLFNVYGKENFDRMDRLTVFLKAFQKSQCCSSSKETKYSNEDMKQILDASQKLWDTQIDPKHMQLIPRRDFDKFLLKNKIVNSGKEIESFFSGVLHGTKIEQYEKVKHSQYQTLVYKSVLRRAILNIIQVSQKDILNEDLLLSAATQKIQRDILYSGVVTKNSVGGVHHGHHSHSKEQKKDDKSAACQTIVTTIQKLKYDKRINIEKCKGQLDIQQKWIRQTEGKLEWSLRMSKIHHNINVSKMPNQ